MARKLIKIFILLLVIALIAMGLIYYALFISINQIDIRYETLSSDKIPDAMNDVKIAYFTDLEYGNFVDEQRLDMIIDKINYAAADVIIFGGDLFDDPGSQLEEDDIKTIQEKLESLDAPLGKFAVLGERDCVNETVREQVSTLLEDADFEILDNRSLHIRNGSNSGIVLIGTQPLINGSPEHRPCRIQYHQRRIQYHDHPLSGSVHQGQYSFFFSFLRDCRTFPRFTDQSAAVWFL